ncbi:MAG: hypothetical protein DDT40_01790 [candidate division WS2 bacterium]|nr:hypothetical protein [Candidatus Psychracetigena formicireducens]
MLSSYAGLNEKTKEIEKKLDMCGETLEGIEPVEKMKYENPQYRLWSGDIEDLEGFTVRLEEWLNQPPVAEAKRYLSDLRKWSESREKVSVEEIERDWRFLSDNIEEIKEIHKQTGGIGYESIKKKTSSWVLDRIIEKDIERAKNWAINANKFANSLRQIEDKKGESKLAEEVKKDAVKELLKISSFDKDNKETIEEYQELINGAENIVKNKPAEIEEKAILKTYGMGKGVESSLSTIGREIEKIRTSLIDLEWVKEFTNSKDYRKLWTEKQTAIRKNDLESIAEALESTQQRASKWKEARKREIDGAFIRIERMSKSVEKDELKKEVTSLEERIRSIDWNKPDLESLSEVLSQMDRLRKQLREELIIRLQNEDAILMIEEPEIIEDMGKRKGWDLEKFIRVLEIVLRNGLIEIRAVEEK